MPFPESLTLVTVRIQFDTPPDGGAFGAVRFTSPQALVGPADDSIVPPIDQLARIASDGSGMIRLPARNVTGWDPVDWAYTVTASVNGNQTIRGTLILNPDDTEVQLADRLQITSGSVIVPGVMYVTGAQLAAGLATKADLVHTHTIEQVVDLQTQLDGKQPAGTYVTAEALAAMDLVSYQTLQEELEGYLPNTYLDISTAPTTGTGALGDVVMTRVGFFRCIVAGSPGTWRWLTPSQAMEHGFAGWMGDPANIQGSLIFTGGIPYVWRFRADTPTISAMNLHLTTPGTNLTNAFWTLHNDDGTPVSGTAQSANQNTNLQTGGERTMPIPTQTVTPGQFYRARFWATTSGGAMPTGSRMCSSSNAAINAGGVLWYSSAAGGLTDLASAPANIGALSSTVPTVAWWAGWKP